MTRKLRLTLASVLAVAALGAIAPAANAYVYWGNSGLGTIGRASLDGSGANQYLIGGVALPRGIAVDGNYIYWADEGDSSNGSIGRANLDGTGANTSFITGAYRPYGVAVDGNYIYWTNDNSTIGRANLNGTGANQSFISEANSPRGIVVRGNYIYWANSATNAIGRANLNGTGVNTSFITGASSPFGVAVDDSRIYWGNIDSNTVGRATLNGDGAASNVDASFIAGPSGRSVWGVAVEGSDIYWTSNYTNIGRATLNGSGAASDVNQSFITGTSESTGVAVDSLSDPTIARVGKPTKASLKVKVGCGDSSACSNRLTGKKVGTRAAITPKTVSVGAGRKKTVTLAYTRALKAALAKGGRVSVTATNSATGGAKSITVRVAR